MSDSCVGTLASLSHVLTYTPSIGSCSALLSKIWLEIAQNSYEAALYKRDHQNLVPTCG